MNFNLHKNNRKLYKKRFFSFTKKKEKIFLIHPVYRKFFFSTLERSLKQFGGWAVKFEISRRNLTFTKSKKHSKSLFFFLIPKKKNFKENKKSNIEPPAERRGKSTEWFNQSISQMFLFSWKTWNDRNLR